MRLTPNLYEKKKDFIIPSGPFYVFIFVHGARATVRSTYSPTVSATWTNSGAALMAQIQRHLHMLYIQQKTTAGDTEIHNPPH